MSCEILKSITNFDIEYENNKALCMAYLSYLAYHKLTHIPSNLESRGSTFVKTFNSNGTQAFYAEFDTFRVLSFRGTELDESDDLKADLKFFKKNFNGFKAHSGFVNALQRVASEVMNLLYDRMNKKPIYFIGHSLGGAIAILLSTIEAPTAVYTFASPRVSAGHKFKKHFDNIQHFRYNTRWDLVPHMPPTIFGYSHTGDLISLPGKRFNIFKSHASDFYVEQIKKLTV